MPKNKPVGDFSAFLNQLVASLNRFHKSATIFFAADLPTPFELRSASELRIELPAPDVYSDLRSKWKEGAYARLPMKGICMLDDEAGTANSLVTIKFVCKPLGKDRTSPYPAQLADAILSAPTASLMAISQNTATASIRTSSRLARLKSAIFAMTFIRM